MNLTQFEDQVTGAVDKLSESVVMIRSRRVVRSFPFGIFPVEGSASGIIIDAKGYIVTNYHVIESSEEVLVILKDGRNFTGKVIGGDQATDIALIKIDANNLPAARLGDSEKLKVGQFALAIGNALGLPGGQTVSMGVVSTLGRPLPGTDLIFEGLIQTDAAINPGNSGGALADVSGNVIGMNTAMIPLAQGVGFAIPSNTIKLITGQILEKGRIVRPWMGISAVALNDEIARMYNLKINKGVIVAGVVERGPAALAGLITGDIIRSIGNYLVDNTKDLFIALSKMPLGKETEVRFIRDGREQGTRLKLIESMSMETPRKR